MKKEIITVKIAIEYCQKTRSEHVAHYNLLLFQKIDKGKKIKKKKNYNENAGPHPQPWSLVAPKRPIFYLLFSV